MKTTRWLYCQDLLMLLGCCLCALANNVLGLEIEETVARDFAYFLQIRIKVYHEKSKTLLSTVPKENI
jgi:hypothetical protein